LQSCEHTTDETFALIFQVSQKGPFLQCGRHCRNCAKPVAAASQHRFQLWTPPVPGMWAYGSSKWALRGMSLHAALELAAENIRVNCVFPGTIDTPMLGALPARAKAGLATMVPIGHLGTPEEVANVVCFLASDQACYVTGAEIAVDAMGA
jgi:3alpha(or 20beta)-hydroxysteroid dehydrogenase